jgi:ketosteroid isomerase-like protein
VSDRQYRQPALQPEDLSRLLVERANAGDVDGVVALYEPDAVLAVPDGVAEGAARIRRFYTELLATRPSFVPGEQRPALRVGDLALTSTTLADGTDATAEVARRGADGTWRWVLDRPSVLG